MKKTSDWIYEQYHLGELSESQRRGIEGEEDFIDRIRDLERSDREILDRYPSEFMAERIRQRASDVEEPRGEAQMLSFRPRRIPFVPMAVAAAVLLTAVIAIPRFLQDTTVAGRDAMDTLRPKGADVADRIAQPEIVVYRDGSGGVEVLQDGSSAEEHDLLQIGYLAGGGYYGAILSIDGRGVVTRHWPLESDRAVALNGGPDTVLPYAYELDDAPSFESFILLWSEGSFDVKGAENLLQGYEPGDSEPDFSVLSDGGNIGMTAITIRK